MAGNRNSGNRESKFTPANIAAIITAAMEGGSIRVIVIRSGINIAPATIEKWLHNGYKDIKANKETAYAQFSCWLNDVRTLGQFGRSDETTRMAAVEQAMEMVKNGKEAA